MIELLTFSDLEIRMNIFMNDETSEYENYRKNNIISSN